MTAGAAGRNRTGDNTGETVLTSRKLLYLLSFQRHKSHGSGRRTRVSAAQPKEEGKDGARRLWRALRASIVA